MDAAMVVVDKPAGLPVHPTALYVEGTVVNRLRQKFGAGRVWPVHRLDRETSGLMVCARSRPTARALSMAFGERRVEKEYLAICEGHGPPADEALEVTAPIAAGGARIRIAVHLCAHAGKPAQTSLRCEANFMHLGAPISLWRARPLHGRRHQVRVHLQHAGWPIVGDKIYGASEALYEAFIAGRLTAADWARLRLPRQALHAAAIVLPHPLSGFRVRFSAPLPADLVAFLGRSVSV